MRKYLLFIGLLIFTNHLIAQLNFLVDDYSDPSLWTQVGSLAAISNGKMEFQNQCPGAQQRRVYREIPSTFNCVDDFFISFEFESELQGSGGTAVGHNIFALTERNTEFNHDCPNIDCTGYPPSTQDLLTVGYQTPSPNGGVPEIYLASRRGTEVTVSARYAYNVLGKKIYLTIRKNGSVYSLNLYSDEAYLQKINTVDLEITQGPLELNFVQHGVNASAASSRKLTGSIDNLTIHLNPDNFLCYDGILNGEETEIDCGGPDCIPCEYKCEPIWFTDGSSIFNTVKKVGIGTVDPLYDLSVIGNVGVEGIIRAKEIIVTPDVWADYVFSDEYNLLPIESLNNYIKSNGHLPNVPSDKEVQLNGNSLGETDVILLEKIEELTLYIIQLNNEIQDLESRLDSLNDKKK